MSTTWMMIVDTLQSTEVTSLEPLQTTGSSVVDDNDGCLHPAPKNPNETEFNPWDNPANIISQKTEWWISTICNFGLIPFLFFIGSIGNILSAAVFYRQRLRIRINLCLFTLAIFDELALTIITLMHFEGSYRAFGGDLTIFISYFLGFMSFSWVSQFLSAVIASERCFCVVSPLKAQQMMSTKQMALFISVVTALLIGGFMVVVGHKHTMRCFHDPEANIKYYIIYVTQWYIDNKKAFDIVDVFVYSTIIPIFFLTVVTVTTVVTAVKLRQALAWRNKTVYAMSATGKDTPEDKDQQQKPVSNTVKEAAVTKMLVATSVLFIICILPTIMVQIATFCEPELRSGGKYNNFSSALWTFVSLFKCLNSSLNFPVYCFMGSKFRATLKDVVTCSKTSGKTGSSMASTATAVSYAAK